MGKASLAARPVTAAASVRVIRGHRAVLGRRSGFAAAFMVALAAATACVVVTTSGSSAASAAGQHGFGAAAGAAIDQAAATLSGGRQPLPWQLVGPGNPR